MCIAASDNKIINDIELLLATQFKIKEEGDVKRFLGFDIKRDRDNKLLYINQQTYVNKRLHKFNKTDVNSVTAL